MHAPARFILRSGRRLFGYAQAGFDEIVGVDLYPQANYPFHFIQADPLAYLNTADLSVFDMVHASPPCQKFTSMRHAPGTKKHIDLITSTRPLLQRSGRPFCIENVVGARAYLINPVTLCGSMFDLKAPNGAQLQRHRLFEASFPLEPPARCKHGKPTIGIYGAHNRDRRRPQGTNHKSDSNFPWDYGFVAMGVEPGAMTLKELSESIPPAYARHVADAFFLKPCFEAGAPTCMKTYSVRLFRDLHQATRLTVEAESPEVARVIVADKINKGELPRDLEWQSTTFVIAAPIGLDVTEVAAAPATA